MFSEIFISLEIKRIVPLLFHENIRAVVITSTSCKKKKWRKENILNIWGKKTNMAVFYI